MSRVRAVVRPGSSLGESELRALWALRVDILKLKPSTDREKDFHAFATLVSKSEQVICLEDEGGVCGLIAFQFERRPGPRGRKVLVFLPEYAALRPHARGTAAVMRGYLALLRRTLRPLDLFRTWYVMGAGYPASFLAVERMAEHTWLEGEPMPVFERALIDDFKARFLEGKVDAQGLVAMPTIPPPLRSELQGSAALRRYEALNPNWAQGYGLMILSRTDLRALARVLVRQVTRALRSRQPRRAATGQPG